MRVFLTMAMLHLYLFTAISLVCVQATSDTPAMIEEAASGDDLENYKHEILQGCPSFDLDPDDYVMFPNGTAYVEAYNKTYDETLYVLRGDILTICAPLHLIDEVYDQFSNSTTVTEPLIYLSMVGVGISMVCLLIHLVVFLLVKDLQNLPGCNLASLCLSLFLSYLSLSVSKLNDLPPVVCIASACLTQFFFLASFMWMFVIAFDVFRSILHATGSLRVSNTGFSVKRYLCNSCVTWGTALVFVVSAVVADNFEGTPEEVRPMFEDTCWFTQKNSLLIFFAAPVFSIIILNFLLFGVSAYNIYANRMKSSPGCDTSLRRNHTMYFRLAVIMGVTWIVGAIAALVQNTWLSWMWYPFAVLNTLQGLFILVAFTFTRKVRNFFMVKLARGRRASEQTLSPTFQSYCFYANSIDKDLDKVGDKGGDDKNKPAIIDNIVIHL